MAHPCASADSRRIHAAHSLQPASRSGRQRAGEPPWLRGECEHVGWAELGEAQRLPRGSFLSLSPFTIKPPHPWVKRPYAMVFGLALSRCGYVDPSAGLLGFALLSPTYLGLSCVGYGPIYWKPNVYREAHSCLPRAMNPNYLEYLR